MRRLCIFTEVHYLCGIPSVWIFTWEESCKVVRDASVRAPWFLSYIYILSKVVISHSRKDRSSRADTRAKKQAAIIKEIKCQTWERLGRFKISKLLLSDGARFTDHALRINISEDILYSLRLIYGDLSYEDLKRYKYIIVGVSFFKKNSVDTCCFEEFIILSGEWDYGEKLLSKMSRLASGDPLAKISSRCFHVSQTFSPVELCLGARRRTHLRTSGCEILICMTKKDTAGGRSTRCASDASRY